MKKLIITLMFATLTGVISIAQILYDEDKVSNTSKTKMPDVPYTDIYSLLQTVPGVEVFGNTVSIRGSDPMLGETPMIMLDGVEIYSLDEVNPNDVDHVDVLKGPETAIYGLKGQYGVISIISKSETFMREAEKDRKDGQKKKNNKVSVTYSTGVKVE